MSIKINRTQIFNFGGISPMCSMRCSMPFSIFSPGGFGCYNTFGMFPPMIGCFNPLGPLAATFGFILGSRIGLDGMGKAAKTVGNGIASGAKAVWNGVTGLFKKKNKAEEGEKTDNTKAEESKKVQEAKKEEVKKEEVKKEEAA